MTGTHRRPHTAFIAKADRVTENLEAIERLAAAAKRLLTQVLGIVAILLVITGIMFHPALLPIVGKAIALIRTTVA